MNNNALKNETFWTGWVAVVVLMQIYRYLVHEVGMANLYDALASAFRPHTDRSSKMWMMMAGGLVSLLVFCDIFTVGREGKGILKGMGYGALMGLFVAIRTAVDSCVIYPLTGEVAAIRFFAGVAGLVIAGAVFAVIYRPSSS